MSQLTDAHTIRAITRDGKPWFVADDVCTVLEIDNLEFCRGLLDADECQAVDQQTLISESGLYKLVRSSCKPGAAHLNRQLRDAGLREKFTRPSPSGREFWPIHFTFPKALGAAT
jgi:prophage antirepressor-like protein